MIAWIDIETTGLEVGYHEILEIAVIRTDADWIELDERRWRFFASHPERIAPWLIERGIVRYDAKEWRKTARDGLSLSCRRRGLQELSEYARGCVMAGHNVRAFDLPHIRWQLDQYGMRTTWREETIDSLEMARELLPTARSRSLAALVERYGVELDRAHDALADIRATLAVARRLREIMP